MEEKTCSVQNGRCTCNQGLNPDGTGNCVGKFTHYQQLVLNHLSWQSHVSSGMLVLRQTLCKIKVYVFKDKGVSIITKKWSQLRKAIQRTGKNVEHYKFH